MIRGYQAAGYPAVAILTEDEERTIAVVLSDSEKAQNVFCIGAVGGLRDLRTSKVIDEQCVYQKAFARLSSSEDTVLVVQDYRHIIRNAAAYRMLKNIFPACKARGSMVVLLGPVWEMPDEIKHDVPIISSPLPSRSELRKSLETVVESAGLSSTKDTAESILDSASGLTLSEAESAFALAFAESGDIRSARVLDEKLKLIKQSGKLELGLAAEKGDLGGLGELRRYIEAEVIPSMRDPQLSVRGLLLVGVPGTGKSLAARVAGSILSWPVLRCDVSSLKGSLVGQSEANMRGALALAEAVAPCILYMDEIEKAVGGYASSAQSDSGVTLGMVGILLSWLQEHRNRILTIATCNDYAKLPVELTRAGRFDERFFVDLPSQSERAEIAAIHLGKFGCHVNGNADLIAGITADWTGAEIEQLVKSAARRSSRNINDEVLRESAADIRPIARVKAAEIAALREWGRGQLRIANTSQDGGKVGGRKLSRG